MSTVDDVTARFSAARDLVVRRRDVEWPALTGAMRSLRALRTAQRQGVSSLVNDLLRDAQRWTTRVTTVPGPLVGEQCGTAALIASTDAVIAAQVDSALTAELQQLQASLSQLLAERHPGCEALVAAICRYDRCALVCRPADRAHLRSWLADEDLDVALVTLSELHDLQVVDGIVVIGPPYRLALTRWCQGTDADRQTSWLFAAPPAAELSIVTWPGHGSCRIPQPMLAGGRTIKWAADNNVVSTTVLPSFDVDDIWTPATVTYAFHLGADRERETIPAEAVVLADDSVVFYSPNEGPKPHSIAWDTGDLIVMNVPVGRLRPGLVLAVRQQRVGSDDDIESRADNYYAARWGAKESVEARDAKAALKSSALRALADRRHDGLTRDLGARVGDFAYAASVFNNVTRPDYIAPQKVGAFEALCAVVGHNVDIARHRHLLFRLRAAHRRAGIEATEEMMNVLRTTADWHGPLADNGHATVTLKSGGGRLSVAAIVRIDPGPHEVPISWLGVRRTDVLANVAARDS